MLCSFPSRHRNFIWFLIFSFALYCMPHLELLFPYKIRLSISEAEAAEGEEDEKEHDNDNPPPREGDESTLAVEDSLETFTPTVSFKVDDFTGAAHLGYPILVPPGRNGLAPKLSLSYSSSAGNSWVGVGWDIPIGFIQRRGPRKGVPTYDDTKDVYELNLGGSPQELVSIGSDEYRLKIEGAYLWIKYYSSGNYWEVKDKSGTKMKFGSTSTPATAMSRIGKVWEPNTKNETFRWYLDWVEDPKTNYMQFIYWRDNERLESGQYRLFQIYLDKIQYNGQVSGGLSHNHEIFFNLESTDRNDLIYNYRGGFKTKTRKRLSTIDIKTNGNRVRKYELQYLQNDTINPRSLLKTIILYGNDGTSTLPPTNFTYQTHTTGFADPIAWENPSGWNMVGGNLIRNVSPYGLGSYTDVMDMDRDALQDRIVYDKDPPSYTEWNFYVNLLNKFDTGVPWTNPSSWDPIYGNYIRNTNNFGTYTEVMDMDGDAMPDRLVYSMECVDPYDKCTWSVYPNIGNEFANIDEPNWPNPSAWDDIEGNYIRNKNAWGTFTEVVDMNADGWPDRVVFDRLTPEHKTWKVFLNNGEGFEGTKFEDGIDWYNPSAWSSVYGNHIRNSNAYGNYTDLIDMNGDGLPDRVVYDRTPPYEYPYAFWTVYFNNGNGFDGGVQWQNPSAWNSINGNYIKGSNSYGIYADVIDMNGDGLPDRVIYDRTGPDYNTWIVYLNNGSGFNLGMEWANPSGWALAGGNYIRENYFDGVNVAGVRADVIDLDGDGLPDRVLYDMQGPDYKTWSLFLNKGPVSDLLSKVENGIGGSTEISYAPSTAYVDEEGKTLNYLPFVLQTVSSYTNNDGRGGAYIYNYIYSGGLYDSPEVEFRGFKNVTAYQMSNPDSYESKTETEFHQDYYKKGRPVWQLQTSKEGHTKLVQNNWSDLDLGNNIKFPRLMDTTSTITDLVVGTPYSYTATARYVYEPQTLNMTEEHKNEGSQEDAVRTFYEYAACWSTWILAKPTKITVKNYSNSIQSRKWMDYDCTTGSLLQEEVCKTDSPATGCDNKNPTQNPVITYDYYDQGSYIDHGPLWKVFGPRNGQLTTLTYESTQTHVYTTTKCVDLPNCSNTHTGTTEYDLGTGNLKKLIPPHLQGTLYSLETSYDVFGRKFLESQPLPIGGWTSYEYWLGDPLHDNQYVKKIEHIVGGPSVLNHESYNYFDGLSRTYKVKSSGPPGKWILTETSFDNIGRVWKRFNPRFETDPPPYYYTQFTYDGFSRVIDTLTPDNYHIGVIYRGLQKIVTNQRQKSTANTYDVYQRLKKVEEDYNRTTGQSYSVTEYSYNTLGNLTQVIAARGATEENTTAMTYDSLSEKRTMTDPDMGYWTYEYDESGNLKKQTDPKNPTQGIIFNYDGLNRLTDKIYPDRPVTFTYDEIQNCVGKLTKVSDPSGGEIKEDRVLACDLMQRVTRSQKTIGSNSIIFEKGYDSAGRVVSITYPGARVYSYEYDVAGDLLYLKDNATQNNVVAYSTFTSLGQPSLASFSNSVSTTYGYYPQTGRLYTLLTQKPGNPTYQNLTYQYDPKGNIINLNDQVNGIIHTYGYDPLDRLDWAKGNNGSIYDHNYDYDRIGNITYKTGVGTYSYTYSNRPHAVQSAGPFTFTYDANGNMTSKTGGGVNITITPQDWNYDNKPTRIQNGSAIIDFVYDGNGQRVKKTSPGQTVFYFGELYELRNGVEILHLFAGSRRIASIRLTDGNNQFYHPNHLGSASVITDQNGARKEQIEYHPFGTYRDVGSPTGTYDYDATFPDVNYTFTDQEDDDETGFYNYGARLYDPLLGKFISPDSLVQAPDDPQTLNRYSYARNNPIIYTDPSGNIFGIDDAIIATIITTVLTKAAIGAAVGATVGGATAAIQGGDIPKGMTMGAVTGAFMGVASGGGILVQTAAGAAAGAINAEISGGNVGMGALSGGGFSLAQSVIGVPNFEYFNQSGDSIWAGLAGTANHLINTSLTGAAYGAAYAGVTGGDVLEGAGMGALGWAAGDAANMAIGHAVGLVASGGKAPTVRQGASFYDANLGGYITFGNVITGPQWRINYGIQGKMQFDPSVTYFKHEYGHVTPQGTALGPIYLPAHVASLAVGGLIGIFAGSGFMEGTHEFGLLERFWHPVPAW